MTAKYINHCMNYIVFDKALVHADVAARVFSREALIHGAGFVDFAVENEAIVAQVHGRSDSLCRTPLYEDGMGMIHHLGIAHLESEDFGDEFPAIDESIPFRFVNCHGRYVLFVNQVSYEQVLKGAYFSPYNSEQANSLGTVAISLSPKGKFIIKTSVDTTQEGSKVIKSDRDAIATLLGIKPHLVGKVV